MSPYNIGQLRHLFKQLVQGEVRSPAAAKRIAEGILGPVIEAYEREQAARAAHQSVLTVGGAAAPAANAEWKGGAEFLPFHPSASHVDPAYRDGWNDCYRAAAVQLTPDEATWCDYVAGMIGCYLGEPDDSPRCKAMAGIIERRLWALPSAKVAPPRPVNAVTPTGEAPTTYLQRFGDAVTLLCGGNRPSEDLLKGWLDGSNDELQNFAATHGPEWAQGIGLLDAAAVTADQPTEEIDHEFLDKPAACAAEAELPIPDSDWAENPHGSLKTFLGQQQVVKYWMDAYSNPESGKEFQGHAMVVKLLGDYLQLMTSFTPVNVAERLPNELQDVVFCVESKDKVYNGRWLGGRYTTLADMPTFSTPGVGWGASQWLPFPAWCQSPKKG